MASASLFFPYKFSKVGQKQTKQAKVQSDWNENTTYQGVDAAKAVLRQFRTLNAYIRKKQNGLKSRNKKAYLVIGKEEIKLSLFAYNMIFYVDNPKEPILKRTLRIYKFSCKINWLYICSHHVSYLVFWN